MLQTRELFDTMTAKGGFDSAVLADAVDVLQECEEVVAACATGMLAEPDAAQLAPAISRDLDCADVAGTTRRVLTRSSGPDDTLVHTQLEACLVACERSHELCSRHADHHAHCRMCAATTRRCAEMCRRLLYGKG
ncbi:hypothetical protein [Streptomyces violens]|uniref:hypothetical protein n=1 Tax=Streptomyces violens TaxID=66377 RepID=UPI0004BF1F0D|nr:hypothetical protein [Streptomyces violens]